MRDAPELHLAGAYCHGRIDLAVDRNDLGLVGQLDVFDSRKRRSGNPRSTWEKFLNAVDDKCARHAAEDLIVDEAVCVRMVPEQARALPAERWDAHLVLKCFAGVNMWMNTLSLLPCGDTLMP